MSAIQPAPPATIVIFGVLGDLTRRLLIPALVNLRRAGLQDAATQVIGVSHHDLDDAQLRDHLDDFIEGADAWERLREHVGYLRGDFDDDATYAALSRRIDGSAVFYLATAPSFFGPIAARLGAAGLLRQTVGFRRLVVEKPFGRDLASAVALNTCLLSQAGEDQIYRIDHFLGKETVQNIQVARFGNAVFEALWNCGCIDHVQITAAETLTVGKRGKSYDTMGALRDMMPNHLFQLLALIAMEPPAGADAEATRIAKARVITAVLPVAPEDAVRGRYAAGSIAGEAVSAYLEAEDVDPEGATETYVALKVTIDTPRWRKAPFYLRTGKAMSARDTEIVVQFRPAPTLAGASNTTPPPPNRLVLQLLPDEGIDIDILVKTPGPGMATTAARLEFRYAAAFDLAGQTGYETLLHAVMVGDQSLFQSAGQIEAAWRALQPLLTAWGDNGAPDPYPAGSAGPESADALMRRDGRAWHALG